MVCSFGWVVVGVCAQAFNVRSAVIEAIATGVLMADNQRADDVVFKLTASADAVPPRSLVAKSSMIFCNSGRMLGITLS
jgi:hypothetical protein